MRPSSCSRSPCVAATLCSVCPRHPAEAERVMATSDFTGITVRHVQGGARGRVGSS